MIKIFGCRKEKMSKRLCFFFVLFLIFLPNSLLYSHPNLEIGATENIPDLAVRIYNWLVRIGGILALLMIVWGGVEYTFFSTAAPARVSDAKDRIAQAVIGLLIVLFSWILLNIINPMLVSPPR